MPSSYTTSGIELIGDGEQSGSWGNTTNTNLEIIDRLTSQAGAIALSGTTHTLSLSDGTLSDGQYAVLVFSGAPSGTNTVTISPNDAKRVFIVKNSSGQSVILTQGSGGNVTIANGKTGIVYCDGAGSSAAVVDVSSTFVSSTVADIGALTPTDGNFIVGNGTTWIVEAGNTVLNSLGVTATATELNTMDGITATTIELNVLDGITATTAELNYTDGVTSSIQTQLDAKAAQATTLTAGTGLTGGGDLSTNRTISAEIATQAEAEAGTVTDKLMTPERTKQAVEALAPGGLGQDQTWQNVGSSRSLNTTYTNNTGKPIMLNLVTNSVGSDTTVRIRVTVGSATMTIANESYPGGRGIYAAGNIVVPSGSTYSVAMDYDGSSLGFSEWYELR